MYDRSSRQERSLRMSPKNMASAARQTYSSSPFHEQPRMKYDAKPFWAQGTDSPLSPFDYNQVASPKPTSPNPQTYNLRGRWDHEPPFNWNNTSHWSTMRDLPPVPLEEPLTLSILGQLQGNYKTFTPTGFHVIEVVIPAGSVRAEKPYGLVRRVCDDGQVLQPQFIHEESSQFTLCSRDGFVEAAISKGANLRHCVRWSSIGDGVCAVWLRIKAVMTSTSCNPSFRQTISCSSSSKSSIEDWTEFSRSASLNSVSPELNTQFSNMSLLDSNRHVLRTCSNPYPPTTDLKKSNPQEHVLFELIKAQCNNNPWLMEKLVEWGRSQNAEPNQITRESALKLSEGRIWVTARSIRSQDEDDKNFQDALDDLKGAYQEHEQGVYRQPKPQGSEPGIQHRLFKSSLGLWVIEKYDFDHGTWGTCVSEQADGRWVDLKSKRIIEVRLVPLLRILESLGDRTVKYQKLEKNVEFLYTSCNQKKLNGKLKTRNLKHNIANLKAKLEKQYALSFAVLVANAADSITR